MIQGFLSSFFFNVFLLWDFVVWDFVRVLLILKIRVRGKEQNIGNYGYTGTWILWIYRKYRWIF